MLNKVSFVVPNLLSSQLSYYLTRNLNDYLLHNILVNVNVFVKYVAIPLINPEFSIMRLEELWGNSGTVITTNLELTNKVLRLPNKQSIYFYVYDLEWLNKNKREQYKFENLMNLYNNEDIKLIARTETHAKLIEDCWNTKVVGIAENFDIKELFNIIGIQP